MRKYIAVLILIMITFGYSALVAAKQDHLEYINKVTGQNDNESTLITTDDVDREIRSSGVALATVGSKICIITFFISFLIKLMGSVLNHPGYIKWSRMMMFGAIIGFIIIRLAPIALSDI